MLGALRRNALKRPVTAAMVLRMASGAVPPIGNNPAFRAELACAPTMPEFRLRLVLSVEDQEGGYLYHLSASVHPRSEINGHLPHPMLVEAVMTLLQLPKGIAGSVKVWIEGDTAVNILQAVEEGAAVGA